MGKNEVTELSNELTYRHYLMDKGRLHELFQEMTIPEYIALQIIVSEHDSAGVCSGKIYLKDLSGKMQLTIRQASKMMSELKDKGLILWSHDGDGSEGTYVAITERGKKLFAEQEQILKQYYGNVIEKFGKQNLINLIQLMKQLESIMGNEIEDLEVKNEHI